MAQTIKLQWLFTYYKYLLMSSANVFYLAHFESFPQAQTFSRERGPEVVSWSHDVSAEVGVALHVIHWTHTC